MDLPLLTLRSSVFNALFPAYMRNLFWAIIIVFPFFGAAYVLGHIGTLPAGPAVIIEVALTLAVFGALVPLTWKIIMLRSTVYYFHSDRVVREFRFFTIRQQSVHYAKITNITVDISLWDRVCNAGDIILHTADDQEPNLVLAYVRDPRAVHQRIYELVQQATRPAASPSAVPPNPPSAVPAPRHPAAHRMKH